MPWESGAVSRLGQTAWDAATETSTGSVPAMRMTLSRGAGRNVATPGVELMLVGGLLVAPAATVAATDSTPAGVEYAIRPSGVQTRCVGEVAPNVICTGVAFSFFASITLIWPPGSTNATRIPSDDRAGSDPSTSFDWIGVRWFWSLTHTSGPFDPACWNAASRPGPGATTDALDPSCLSSGPA